MNATYNLKEAQRRLPHLLRQAAKGDTIAVANGDETVAYVVAKEHYDSLIETLELMSNPAALKALRRDKAGRSRFRPLSALDDDES